MYKVIFLAILLLTTSVYCKCEEDHCSIIDNSLSVSISGKNITTVNSVCIEIKDPLGKYAADISIPYQKGNKPEITEACIIDRNNKVVRKIKNSEIVISSDFDYGTFFSDYYKMSFSLFWNDYPYRIRLSYKITNGNYIYLSNWTPYVFLNSPVQNASLTVTVPKDYQISLYQRGTIKSDTTITDKTVTYCWKAENLPSIENETFEPPLVDEIPRVIVMPGEFNYEIKGRLDSWQTYGQWYYDLTLGLDQLTPEEKMKVALMTEELTDKKEIIRKLYHYLQDNTRYINVSLETGGHKPYPASYVCEKKYGDCKALTVYMKALLREAGIKSYYALINLGDDANEVIREAPGPQFNHVILCVPVDKDTIWLDNTATHTPFPYINISVSNRTTLLVDSLKSRLVLTPKLSEEEVLNSSFWQFNLNNSAEDTVKVRMIFRGNRFDDFTYYKKYTSEKQLKEIIEKLLPVTGSELNEWTLEQANRDDNAICLTCTVKVPKQCKSIGKYMVISAIPFKITLPETPDKRQFGFYIPYPVVKSDTMTYRMESKSNYTCELPENIFIKSEFGSMQMDFSETPDEFIVIRNFILKDGRYDKESYSSFYDFINSINQSMIKTSIILKKQQ